MTRTPKPKAQPTPDADRPFRAVVQAQRYRRVGAVQS